MIPLVNSWSYQELFPMFIIQKYENTLNEGVPDSQGIWFLAELETIP